MSHSTQADSGIIPSVVQPGAPLYPLPDPLPGALTLGPKTRVGSYSDVYMGTWTHNDEDKVACIKCLRNTAPAMDPTCPNLTPAERFERRIRRETSIWIQSKHANVLPFLGYQVIQGEPRLVSPWMENGSLDAYLKFHPDLSDIDELVCVSCGLAYLHSLQPPIIHGDIKSDNVIITDDMVGSLCDFGISRLMTSIGTHTGLTISGQGAGTAGYQAKELYDENSRLTAMSDVNPPSTA
ncbi:hypothetical protein M407DRAFT_234846 [Tulasnella calospora MUT 4182]|uniref:Protein kinase domain-containing protein n=1 Tax=Tulasnella calospora MUT 4182 TaxID=1051891 RepID=A0A0C3Q0M4_9AGAM|nr:hypothetical protein M407DRAFT_234846 [Tulasnella calospora MUT 4182]